MGGTAWREGVLTEPFAIYTGTKGGSRQGDEGGKVTKAEVIKNKQTTCYREEPGYSPWYDNQERQNLMKVGGQQD